MLCQDSEQCVVSNDFFQYENVADVPDMHFHDLTRDLTYPFSLPNIRVAID